MDDQQQGNGGGVVNMTRAVEALSPLLNQPKRRIIQVEALVTAAAALLFLQLVLGTCKRRWHNSVVKGALSVTNAVMFPLIFYTFSVMQSSPIKNSVYPVLAVSLLMAAGGTNAVNKYDDFHDNKKLMGYAIEMARYAFYLFMLVTLVIPATFKQYWHFQDPLNYKGPRSGPSSACVIYLSLVTYISAFAELWQGFSQSRSVHNGKLVAKWMKKKANDRQKNNDPESLKVYNYLVMYTVPRRRGYITVGKIWSFYSNSGGNGKALKDVCLSLALFELLKRRYYGLVCAEATLPETRDFVFGCLLPTEADYKRAFRIVEMELGFFYDFFFTRYHSIYAAGLFSESGVIRLVLLLAKISLIGAVGVFTFKSSLILETLDPIIEVHSTKVDYIIALLVLSTVLTAELLQAAFYMASDWFKVSLASAYITLPNGCKPISLFLFDKFIGFLGLIQMSVGLRNMIGQYSVISDITDKKRSFWNRRMVSSLLLKKKPAVAEVSDTMKLYIARSLISTQGDLTNGETSLRQNLSTEMFEQQYRWALMKNHHQVELMLIWHIATDYCDLLAPSIIEDRDVAVKLSRYCAHLIASVPELLPYHTVDIKRLRSAMKEQVRHKLSSTDIPETRYRKMKRLAGTDMGHNPRTIFRKGVKLGKQLELMQDGNQRWKVLADFWAETIIYIAPSHLTVKQHLEHLENGGEFLTRIWAILSHAGILNIERDNNKVVESTNPGQFTSEIV